MSKVILEIKYLPLTARFSTLQWISSSPSLAICTKYFSKGTLHKATNTTQFLRYGQELLAAVREKSQRLERAVEFEPIGVGAWLREENKLDVLLMCR